MAEISLACDGPSHRKDATHNPDDPRYWVVKGFIIEHLAELLDVVAYAAASLLLSAIGVGVEGMGIGNLVAGDPILGAWEAFMGAIAIYVGLYLLAYRELRPRIAAIRSV